jgi:CBS domain-containing protein
VFLHSHEKGAGHQGFPLVNEKGSLVGILTRRVLLAPGVDGEMRLEELLRRPAVVVHEDCSLREAADHMVRHDVGRLPVVERGTSKLVGIVTRSDLLRAHRKRMAESQDPAKPTVRVPFLRMGDV